MAEINDAYLKLHRACGIKVGDKVKILRKAKTQEMGWDNAWVEPQNKTVGKILEVTGDSDDKGFYLGSSIYAYPFYVLEKIPHEPEFDLLDEFLFGMFPGRKDLPVIKQGLQDIMKVIMEAQTQTKGGK